MGAHGFFMASAQASTASPPKTKVEQRKRVTTMNVLGERQALMPGVAAATVASISQQKIQRNKVYHGDREQWDRVGSSHAPSEYSRVVSNISADL